MGFGDREKPEGGGPDRHPSGRLDGEKLSNSGREDQNLKDQSLSAQRGGGDEPPPARRDFTVWIVFRGEIMYNEKNRRGERKVFLWPAI